MVGRVVVHMYDSTLRYSEDVVRRLKSKSGEFSVSNGHYKAMCHLDITILMDKSWGSTTCQDGVTGVVMTGELPKKEKRINQRLVPLTTTFGGRFWQQDQSLIQVNGSSNLEQKWPGTRSRPNSGIFIISFKALPGNCGRNASKPLFINAPLQHGEFREIARSSFFFFFFPTYLQHSNKHDANVMCGNWLKKPHTKFIMAVSKNAVTTHHDP